MSVLDDSAALDIKEPSFDRLEGAEPLDLAIIGGTRVVLGYRGEQLSAQVTAVERLGASFVGRVLAFAPRAPRHDDLAPGDVIRFRRKDVLWTE